VFNKFPRYDIKILLADSSAKLGREDNLKLQSETTVSNDI
jgi:hypothetical protein